MKNRITNLTKDESETVSTIKAATLARIWADATPLSKFVEERAEQLCRPVTPLPKCRRIQKLSTIRQLAAGMEFHANLAVARGKAQATTINDVIAGRVVGLGRPSDSYAFDVISAEFWIGAKIDWAGTVIRGGRTVIEVRIVMPNVITSVQPKLQPGLEEMPTADVIRAAIVGYAKIDPFLRQSPPSKRFRTYKSYISSKGFDPNKRGFSDKTLEKYELEYKREIKKLSPI